MMSASFPVIVDSVDGVLISTQLRNNLVSVYRALSCKSPAAAVGLEIETLLSFLCSPHGRTNANCVAADRFFALGEGWGAVSWDYLPENLSDIMALMGEALHDTISAPTVAENFGCTPEQLLSQLRAAGYGASAG